VNKSSNNYTVWKNTDFLTLEQLEHKHAVNSGLQIVNSLLVKSAAPLHPSNPVTGNKILEEVSKSLRLHVTAATEFGTIASNIYVSSVWKLFHITIRAHGILSWILNFWKICAALSKGTERD
jgi:hypothetical protein